MIPLNLLRVVSIIRAKYGTLDKEQEWIFADPASAQPAARRSELAGAKGGNSASGETEWGG